MIQIIKTLLFSSMTIFITISLIQFPDQALEASIRGLNLWWEVVFPSLLPFFITAELLLAFGVVNFIGVLFEPIMRPLFNIPGVGSFGWMMGMASGYPTGAKIAARLREENQLTKIEAERLVAFTNNSSPLFIFGAISIGFFHDASLGVLIAVCHYTSNAIVGIMMRFHGRNERRKLKEKQKKVSVITAFKEMHRTRLKDTRPFGEILGDAVLNSIKTLIMVGGFITLFSVLIKLLFLVGVTPAIAGLIQVVLSLFSLPIEFALPFLSGLFEITIGANMITQITTDTLLPKVILVSFILGFNGFSVQAQVASILAKTDIRFLPYFFARLLHGSIASILTIILFKPLYLDNETSQTSNIPESQELDDSIWANLFELLTQTGALFTFFFLGLAIIILYRRNMKKQ